MRAMAKLRICVCAEAMSVRDEVHGARVLRDSLVTTAVCVGALSLTLRTDDGVRKQDAVQMKEPFAVPAQQQTRLAAAADPLTLRRFCAAFGLPHEPPVIVADRENVLAFWTALQARKDFLTESKYKEFLEDNVELLQEEEEFSFPSGGTTSTRSQGLELTNTMTSCTSTSGSSASSGSSAILLSTYAASKGANGKSLSRESRYIEEVFAAAIKIGEDEHSKCHPSAKERTGSSTTSTFRRSHVDHSEILGDVLEGLVVHFYDKDGGKLVTRKQKFPNYVSRIALREWLKSKGTLVCGSVERKISSFVDKWCITSDGGAWWRRWFLRAALAWEMLGPSGFQVRKANEGGKTVALESGENDSGRDQKANKTVVALGNRRDHRGKHPEAGGWHIALADFTTRVFASDLGGLEDDAVALEDTEVDPVGADTADALAVLSRYCNATSGACTIVPRSGRHAYKSSKDLAGLISHLRGSAIFTSSSGGSVDVVNEGKQDDTNSSMEVVADSSLTTSTAGSLQGESDLFRHVLKDKIRATVVVVLGPVGYGKSTLGSALAKRFPEVFEHIDGDELGLIDGGNLTVTDVSTKLKGERQELTFFRVFEALYVRKKVPVLSVGGGVLFGSDSAAGGGDQGVIGGGQDLRLRSWLRSCLGGAEVEIVAFLPGPKLEREYAQKHLVEACVHERLERRFWAVSGGGGPDARSKFVRMITDLSAKNVRFAQMLRKEAEAVVYYRRVQFNKREGSTLDGKKEKNSKQDTTSVQGNNSESAGGPNNETEQQPIIDLLFDEQSSSRASTGQERPQVLSKSESVSRSAESLPEKEVSNKDQRAHANGGNKSQRGRGGDRTAAASWCRLEEFFITHTKKSGDVKMLSRNHDQTETSPSFSLIKLPDLSEDLVPSFHQTRALAIAPEVMNRFGHITLAYGSQAFFQPSEAQLHQCPQHLDQQGNKAPRAFKLNTCLHVSFPKQMGVRFILVFVPNGDRNHRGKRVNTNHDVAQSSSSLRLLGHITVDAGPHTAGQVAGLCTQLLDIETFRKRVEAKLGAKIAVEERSKNNRKKSTHQRPPKEVKKKAASTSSSPTTDQHRLDIDEVDEDQHVLSSQMSSEKNKSDNIEMEQEESFFYREDSVRVQMPMLRHSDFQQDSAMATEWYHATEALLQQTDVHIHTIFSVADSKSAVADIENENVALERSAQERIELVWSRLLSLRERDDELVKEEIMDHDASARPPPKRQKTSS
ncbi:unnamed protein product [Amoebophrya sp. A25]|nr:unnamed protein product [Amoebophrya sp. A25]|eukprot:GSA25T00024127001.1